MHTFVNGHVQVTEVKRQATKALKHLQQQLLAAHQQHEALQKQVPACEHVTRPCAEHSLLPNTLQADVHHLRDSRTRAFRMGIQHCDGN